MDKKKVVIDAIEWRRVQLYIFGHVENSEVIHPDFQLRNFTETKNIQANSVEFDGIQFICRFNVAIADEGFYLPNGEYLLIYHDVTDHIAEISPQLVDPDYYELEVEKQLQYDEIPTKNGKKNFLLQNYTKVFHHNGVKSGRKYKVIPKISEEVNEFVLQVSIQNKKATKVNPIKNVLNKLKKIQRKAFYAIRLFFFRLLFELGKALRQKNGKHVLFTSDSRASMSGNFEFIYKEMLAQNLDKEYKIHQVFKEHLTARRPFIDKFKFPYFLGHSNYIFVDDYHPILYSLAFDSEQEIIQVWHAVGAFKTVGFSRTGKRGGPFFDSLNHRCYTKAYVSSETDIPFYAEAYGIKEEYVIPTGVPRTDVLFSSKYQEDIRAKLFAEFPFMHHKKIILFAPTFRGNGHKTAHYPFFKIDFNRLATYCNETNAIVLFKMHPFVKNRLVIPEEFKTIFFDFSDVREVNDLLFITDLLISDYSSLIYEFSVFKKPMLFYAFDLEDYVYSRDFYEEYETFVPGKIVETFDALMDSLEKGCFEQEKVELFLNKHFKFQDGQSSKRLVEHLFLKNEWSIKQPRQ